MKGHITPQTMLPITDHLAARPSRHITKVMANQARKIGERECSSASGLAGGVFALTGWHTIGRYFLRNEG